MSETRKLAAFWSPTSSATRGLPARTKIASSPGPPKIKCETLLVLIIAYFAVLGRTGATIFQRLFGMKGKR